MGKNGVCDGPIQKITSGIVSTGQKNIPNTPIMSMLSIQDYGVTRGKKGVKGVCDGLRQNLTRGIDFLGRNTY